MKPKLKYIISPLRYIDLFQQHITLKIDHRYRVSLFVGKLFSLGIIIFILYNAINSDMIKKTNPIVLQQLLKMDLRPNIDLNPHNFFLAFGIADDVIYIPYDSTFYKFEVIQYSYKAGIYKEQTYEFEPCNVTNFKNYSNSIQSSLKNMSCIKDVNLTLKGYWDEEEVDYFSIELKRCVNTSNNSECKSKEEIDEFFMIKYFETYFFQQNFDLNNFENPSVSSIKNTFTGIEIGRRKEISNYLKKTKILTDSKPMFSSYDEIETYIFEEGMIDFQNSDDELLTFCFYSSDYIMAYERRYQKLFDVLATLGGILNPLLLFGSIIVKYVNDWKINELILKKIYSLNIDFFKANNRKTSKSHSCLKLTLWEKIKFLIKSKKNFSQKETIYDRYLKKSEERIDIFEIIKKLEEIQRLKLVLFNNKQLKIFEHFSKKLISNQGEYGQKKFTFDDKKKNLKYSQMIAEHLLEIKNKKNPSELEKNLVKLIEEEKKKKCYFEKLQLIVK